jgi:hypothetical protein
MKIEVGKTYRTRGGDLAKVIKDDASDVPFLVDHGAGTLTRWHDREGVQVGVSNRGLDLVEEVTLLPDAPGIYDNYREAMQQRLAEPSPQTASGFARELDEAQQRQRSEQRVIDAERGIRSLRRSAIYQAAATCLLAIALIVLGMRTANARDLLWMPNAVGGEIVLTNVSKSCPPEYLLAYSRGPDGTVITGCWLIGERYVMIRWSESQRVVLFKPEQFHSFDVEPAVAPTARPEMRL